MNESKIAVFPGSFDPFTLGHFAVIRKALPLFDHIIIAIGNNSSKNGYFDLKDRLKHIEAVYQNETKISIVSYQGLTVDFCIQNNSGLIIRGLRDGKDFEYEKSIAIMNNKIAPSVETVFFMTDAEYSAINSVIVRDIHKHKGDVSKFLPQEVINLITN